MSHNSGEFHKHDLIIRFLKNHRRPKKKGQPTLICTMKSRKCSLKAGMSWSRSNSPWTVSLTCALNIRITKNVEKNGQEKEENKCNNKAKITYNILFKTITLPLSVYNFC